MGIEDGFIIDRSMTGNRTDVRRDDVPVDPELAAQLKTLKHSAVNMVGLNGSAQGDDRIIFKRGKGPKVYSANDYEPWPRDDEPARDDDPIAMERSKRKNERVKFIANAIANEICRRITTSVTDHGPYGYLYGYLKNQGETFMEFSPQQLSALGIAMRSNFDDLFSWITVDLGICLADKLKVMEFNGERPFADNGFLVTRLLENTGFSLRITSTKPQPRVKNEDSF